LRGAARKRSLRLGQRPRRAPERSWPCARLSSAEYLVSEIKRNKRGALLGLAALALAVAGVAFGLYKLISQNQYTTCGERRPL